MKSIIAIIFSLTAIANVAVWAQDNVIDEVVWIVGDDAILRSDVEKVRLEFQQQEIPVTGDPYCYIPEQMAIQKLYLHQALLDSIDFPDSRFYSYVENRLNMIIDNAGSREKLEEWIGKPIEVFRNELRKSAKEQEIIRAVQQKIVGSVKVTPTDVRTFFNRIPKDSLPMIPTTVEVEILTQSPKIAIEEIDDIKRTLRDFTEQITSGKRDFASLARVYSEDKSNNFRGGEMGFVGKAELVPEFAAAAFELNDPKKVSRIVETEYGYHIIQLIEKRGDRINARHILIKPRVSQAAIDTTMMRMDSIRTDIVEHKKFTFEEGARWLSDNKETYNNNGLMVNQGKPTEPASVRVGTARFSMSELPPEIAKVVYDMQVGDVSKPFTMINSQDKEVVAIVKLKSRTEGHRASLSEDYQTLKGMVEDEKQQQILDEWLHKKQQETYTRINENWKNCDFQKKGWKFN
ncbi:MAG: peptidylprolyl isomerase [Candidatus Symbiothrix sp.]|jgi:peptidyl-prolyl cis-trans isomerase SurA|nr:peptidylprolyl isomerase [Candidatus Symbiothrix sp.]